MPSQIDQHGVDLTSGKLILGGADVRIGPSDHRGLRFSRQWSKNAWRIAELPALSGSTSYPIVSFSGRSVPFEPNGSGGYKATFEDGSALSSDRRTFTASDGTQVTFTSSGYQDYTIESSLGLGSQVVFPDGATWTYHYETTSAYLGPEMPLECYEPNPHPNCWPYLGQWQTYYVRRLSSITSSTGYQIKLHYGTDSLTYENMAAWWHITTATALNNAIEYCNPTASTCSFANTWPQATYNNWEAGTIASVTGPEARTTSYSYSTSPTTYQTQLAGIRAPGFTSNTVTYGYTNDKVSSVTKAGETWSYSYGTNSTTVTDPASQTQTVNYSPERLVTSLVAGGLTTSFQYCGLSEPNCPKWLLKTVTMPEGNSVTYAYDARGNQTQQTQNPKPSVGGSAISTYASYAASCSTANLRICNKPTSTTDARGKVTNYTYDAGHGGVTSVKAPADVSGVRPETRITYANRQAYYKNSAGSLVASGLNIALPVQVSSCRTTASCTNGADERRTTIGYGPQTAGTANNLNPVSATTALGNGTLAATSAMAYDNYGRILTVDGPASDTADLTRYRYNLAGQLIGEVGPDPDGTGSSRFLATRNSYNARGQLYMVQSGTVTAQTDAAWTAFTETGRTTTEFDTYGRPVRQMVQAAGGTSHQITDTIYDGAGRVQCTMVRMNPPSWSTVATSCTPTQTGGPNGPDRVTYNHYDALSRVWKVTNGYGVSGVQADEVTRTFTNNGRLATLKDAENNLTTYEYDGHDRLVKTRFPVATKGANSSSTTDYEQVTYDNAGNVLTFRTRRGETLTMTYDNLSRLLTKVVPSRSGLAATHTRNVYLGYDLFGSVSYARFDSAAGEGITNAYNGLGQLTSSTTNMDAASRALSYQYDVAGNVTRVTHPDGTYINYTRHASGVLDGAALNGSSSLFDIGLDTAGRPTSLQRWSTTAGAWSLPSSFGYDAVSRLSSLTHNVAGSSYDVSRTFTYNPASQIASQTQSNDTYAWTAAFNADRSYTANGLNQYSAVATTSFGYDDNGNLTSDGTNTYVYDVENRLVTRSGGASATLRYDPLGRLYEITGSGGTRRLLYDGSDLVAEYNTSGTLLRRYVHGDGAGDDPLVWFEGSGVADSARRYLYADERGSIVAVTDSSGNVTNVNTYDEYGIPGPANTGAFQYTGQVWLPELGMYHYKARMYSPTLGRFMQTDPIGYGDGMNMYAYVSNDPVNGVDPTGLICWGDRSALEAQGIDTSACHPPVYVNGKLPDLDPFVDSYDCVFGACNAFLNPPRTSVGSGVPGASGGSVGSGGRETPQSVTVDESCSTMPAASNRLVQERALDAFDRANASGNEYGVVVATRGNTIRITPSFTTGQDKNMDSSVIEKQMGVLRSLGYTPVLFIHAHHNNPAPSPVGGWHPMSGDFINARNWDVPVAALDRAGSLTCTNGRPKRP